MVQTIPMAIREILWVNILQHTHDLRSDFKPIWMYGNHFCGCSNEKNIENIQTFQKKCCRALPMPHSLSEPRYASRSQDPYWGGREKTWKTSTKGWLHRHVNVEAFQLLDNWHLIRRLCGCKLLVTVYCCITSFLKKLIIDQENSLFPLQQLTGLFLCSCNQEIFWVNGPTCFNSRYGSFYHEKQNTFHFCTDLANSPRPLLNRFDPLHQKVISLPRSLHKMFN